MPPMTGRGDQRFARLVHCLGDEYQRERDDGRRHTAGPAGGLLREFFIPGCAGLFREQRRGRDIGGPLVVAERGADKIALHDDRFETR